MNRIDNNYPIKNLNNEKRFLSFTFKATPNKKVVEIPDEIFKLASATISAAGIAALGIKAKSDSEKPKEEVPQEPEKQLVKKAAIAKILGINIHSVNWHIDKGRLILDDKLIDLNNEHNKRFIAEFQKGKRKHLTDACYSKEMYPMLRDILNQRLSIEYCLQNGLLVAEEDGTIDMLKEPNKSFIEKIKSGELGYKNFIQSQEFFARETLGVNINSLKRAIKRGEIILEANGRIDINNATNKAFIEKVRQARKNAEAKGYKRVKTFAKSIDKDPNLLTKTELAKKLGYNSIQGIIYHVKNGRLIFENGYCDISKEPNKSFIEAKLSGKLLPSPVTCKKREQSNLDKNPNWLSKAEFARRCGISNGTLTHHIECKHVVVNSNGKIDITDETNKFFIENHKKGQPLYPQKPTEPKTPKDKELIIKDPNIITLSDLVNITGLAPTTILYHVTKGRLIHSKNGFDVTNPINKKFITLYEENQLEKINKMSFKDLTKLNQKVIERYKSLLSKNLYEQAQEAKNESEEEFDNYIKNITFSLFRVEILSVNELNFLEETIKNIISARLEDKSKPKDFSDIKEFQLSGIIELEQELNIINKLIEFKETTSIYKNYRKSDDITKKKTFQFASNNLSKYLKPTMTKEELDKLNAALNAYLEKIAGIEFENMTVENLQKKILELFINNEQISENKDLSECCDFALNYQFEKEEEKELLVNFVKELNRFAKDSSKKAEFSKDALKPMLELAKSQKELDAQKQEKFKKIRKKLDNTISLLYTIGLTRAAMICSKNAPENIDEIEKIERTKYLIRLTNKIYPGTPHIVYGNKNNDELQKRAIIRAQKIEDIIVAYDAKISDSELYKSGVEFAEKRYGNKNNSHVGEYIRHLYNLQCKDFSSYPEFCRSIVPELHAMINVKPDIAIMILSKLEQWKNLSDKEQKSFCKMCELFSKDIKLEKTILENYIDNYYTKYDTIVKATGQKDKKIQVDVTFATRGKEELCKKVTKAEWINYFEGYESAMTIFVGKNGRTGIKDYYTEGGIAHEVKNINYPGRLFCYKTDLVFDGFDYDKDN